MEHIFEIERRVNTLGEEKISLYAWKNFYGGKGALVLLANVL